MNDVTRNGAPDAPRRPGRRRFILGAAAVAAGLAARAAGADEPPPAAAPKQFMLTFDDGPLPGKTERVLDALAGLAAADGQPPRAAFFMLGDPPERLAGEERYYAPYELWRAKGSIRRHPDTARRVRDAGHCIGSHTQHHAWFRWPWLDSADGVKDEIAAWEAVARPVVGDPSPKLLRPPYLVDNAAVREGARQAGYQIVMGHTVGDANPFGSVESVKWSCRRILANWSAPEPAVLIFHDILPTAVGHLAEVVRHLQDQGHQLAHFDPARIA